tara:strand:+ start:298 stop:444 length:147 start_codon:yes stop_codon:yes gene_type:complete
MYLTEYWPMARMTDEDLEADNSSPVKFFWLATTAWYLPDESHHPLISS